MPCCLLGFAVSRGLRTIHATAARLVSSRLKDRTPRVFSQVVTAERVDRKPQPGFRRSPARVYCPAPADNLVGRYPAIGAADPEILGLLDPALKRSKYSGSLRLILSAHLRLLSKSYDRNFMKYPAKNFPQGLANQPSTSKPETGWSTCKIFLNYIYLNFRDSLVSIMSMSLIWSCCQDSK
jgi:hypothetical protein